MRDGNYTMIRTRLKLYPLVCTSLLLSFALGTLTPIGTDLVKRLYEDHRRVVEGLGLSPDKPLDYLTYRIFLVSVQGVVVSTAPLIGYFSITGTYYFTGLVARSLSIMEATPVQSLVTPYFLIEALAYTLTSTESLILAWALVKRRLRDEVGISVGIALLSAAILLLSATLEALSIKHGG